MFLYFVLFLPFKMSIPDSAITPFPLKPNELEKIVKSKDTKQESISILCQHLSSPSFLNNIHKNQIKQTLKTYARFYSKNNSEFKERYDDLLLEASYKKIIQTITNINKILINSYLMDEKLCKIDFYTSFDILNLDYNATTLAVKKLFNKAGWKIQATEESIGRGQSNDVYYFVPKGKSYQTDVNKHIKNIYVPFASTKDDIMQWKTPFSKIFKQQ